MKRISRIACVLIGILLAVLPLSSCGGSAGEGEGEKLSIVATVFPGYDFARTIVDGIEGVQLKMLLKPGSENHSYEPPPQDLSLIHIYGAYSRRSSCCNHVSGVQGHYLRNGRYQVGNFKYEV